MGGQEEEGREPERASEEPLPQRRPAQPGSSNLLINSAYFQSRRRRRRCRRREGRGGGSAAPAAGGGGGGRGGERRKFVGALPDVQEPGPFIREATAGRAQGRHAAKGVGGREEKLGRNDHPTTRIGEHLGSLPRRPLPGPSPWASLGAPVW